MSNGNRNGKQRGRSPAQAGRHALATIIGSSSWRLSLAVSLLLTKAPSASPAAGSWAKSSLMVWRTQSSWRSVACWLAAGIEAGSVLSIPSSRLAGSGLARADSADAAPGTLRKLTVYTVCHMLRWRLSGEWASKVCIAP